MAKRRNGAFDRRFGQVLRYYRQQSGMRQQELAERIGVSFQQVQKYEKGDNRVSLARAVDIGHIFMVPLEAMLEMTEDEKRRTVTPSRETTKLMHSFNRIKNKNMRRQISRLVKLMADDPDD